MTCRFIDSVRYMTSRVTPLYVTYLAALCVTHYRAA
jgi:hypothetical protein